MLDTLLAKVVGTQNERELKRLRPLVAAEDVLLRLLKRPQRTGRPHGLRAARINIPRYRQLAVLAQKPA